MDKQKDRVQGGEAFERIKRINKMMPKGFEIGNYYSAEQLSKKLEKEKSAAKG